jgi:hypothetical protein
MNRAIYWYHVATFLGGFVIALRIIMALPKAAPPGLVTAIDYAMPVVIPLFGIGIFFWIRRRFRGDLQPDILTPLFGEKSIREFDGGHFAFEIVQVDPSHLRIAIAVQNIRAGDGVAFLTFDARRGVELLFRKTINVQIPLEGAQVVGCCAIVPMAAREENEELTFRLNTRCKTSGRRVRFRRHRILINEMEPAMVVLAFIATHGHVHGRHGTTFRLSVHPGPSAPPGEDVRFRRTVLWESGDPPNLETIGQQWQLLLDESREPDVILCEVDEEPEE